MECEECLADLISDHPALTSICSPAGVSFCYACEAAAYLTKGATLLFHYDHENWFATLLHTFLSGARHS
jgi:hypothetical protein